MGELVWTHWIFTTAKLKDHDVWRLRSTHFGRGVDFDSQSQGQDSRGRPWYGRQHNDHAGQYRFRLSSKDEAEAELRTEWIKHAYGKLPRKVRGVMRFDYISRRDLDGTEIDKQLDDADQDYFYKLGFEVAYFMNKQWHWPTAVIFCRPVDQAFEVWNPQTGSEYGSRSLSVRQHPRRVAMRGCQSHPTSRRGYPSYRGSPRWPGAHENVDGTVIVGMPARSGKWRTVTCWHCP